MAIKSILTASVLSVIGVAVSTTAFADNMVNASTFCKPGFYAGVQGGRSDTFYSPSNTLAQAVNDGAGTAAHTVYTDPSLVGAIPYSYNTTVTTNRLSAQKTDDVGMGGRIYAGYQFNPYFAIETGYTQYGKTTFHANGVQSAAGYSYDVNRSTGAITDPQYTGRTDTAKRYYGEITEHAIDLVGKATLPLQMGFGLYAKAGMAFIAADRHLEATTGTATVYNATNTVTSTTGTNSRSTIYTKSYQSFSPVAGVGVNYTIPNTNLSVDASYTRVFSYGGIPNAKLAALGLEYKFA